MPESVKASSLLFRFYHGRSMRHTFRDGDCVFFEAVPLKSLRAGDVVVYSGEAPGSEDVIHRIVSIESSSLLTRGDNNSFDEVDKIDFTRILGKALFYQRSGSRRRVSGGLTGVLRARLLKRKGLFRLSFRLLYSLLRKSGIVRLFWKPRISIISISTDPAAVVRLVYKGKTIGKMCTDSNRFVLGKPFDLAVRLEDLPPLKR